MSGHNKWSSIKHKKGAEDAKRSRVFSKYSKLISIAARDNSDFDSNANLKSVIDQARSVNMPKDKIEKAIKCSSDKDIASLKEIVIQAIGPENLALIIEAITDNSNRTINEVKAILTKQGTKVTESGSLDWMFEKRGVIRIGIPNDDRDEIELSIIETGAQDIKQFGDIWIIFTSATDLSSVQSKLKEKGLNIENAQIEMIATNPIKTSIEASEQIGNLISAIEENDDVGEIYTNLEL